MKYKRLLEVLVAGLIGLPFMSYGEENIPALREKAERGNALAQNDLGAGPSKESPKAGINDSQGKGNCYEKVFVVCLCASDSGRGFF